MKNIENKEALRQAATLAVGATPQEQVFWGEVERYLNDGTVSKPEVEPRLTKTRETGTV